LVPFCRTRSSCPWLAAHGLNLRLLFEELFSGHVSAFFGLDVIISALVLLIFIFREGTERRIRMLWLPVAPTCLIAVSCGLPLFLYLRERQLARAI
jgi:Terpene cyclase DEP1